MPKTKTFRSPLTRTATQRRRDYDKQRAQDIDTVRRRALYGSSEWKKLRALKLTDCPTCEYCRQRGRVTAAREVDHYLPVATHPQLALDYDNLRSSCTPCHSSKTASERSARPWRGHDLQGYPMDPRHHWNAPGHGPTLADYRPLPTPQSRTHAVRTLGKKGGLE